VTDFNNNFLKAPWSLYNFKKMKTCTKCKIEKELELFTPDLKLADGRKSICKVCNSIYQKKYRERPKNEKKQRNPFNQKEDIKYELWDYFGCARVYLSIDQIEAIEKRLKDQKTVSDYLLELDLIEKEVGFLKENYQHKIEHCKIHINTDYLNIKQLDFDYNVINIFSTLKEASDAIGNGKYIGSSIAKCLRGEQETAAGFIWEYE